MKPKVILKSGKHHNNDVVFLIFPKDAQLIAAVKTLGVACWSQTQRKWYIKKNEFDLSKLFAVLKEKAFIDYSGLNEKTIIKKNDEKKETLRIQTSIPLEIEQGLTKLKLWMTHKRYSESTIATYLDGAKSFLVFIHPKPIVSVTNEDVVLYVNEYIIKRGLSFSYQNQVVNAIKLFFKEIVRCSLDVDKIERPRRENKLPNVLSKEEVKLILNAHNNIKHKTMLSLIYSCGLRRSELLNLKPTDIDSKRNIIIIKQAKGKKDRIVPLSQKILTMLREYYSAYKPKTWLFEGQKYGEKYDERSLANVLKQALAKVNITKPVSLHLPAGKAGWLRHSYATHLLESGTDLRYIQELLGHSSSRTTEIYTHVSTKNIQQIKSPFDDL
ncbi:MAG: site-specific integrase [Ignavibacteria bacterium]|nr:site-specific integrase [Ignavibacteria bacterium]